MNQKTSQQKYIQLQKEYLKVLDQEGKVIEEKLRIEKAMSQLMAARHEEELIDC